MTSAAAKAVLRPPGPIKPSRIYGELAQFQAEGGGDTPEAVNQALSEAIDASGWSPRDEVLKHSGIEVIPHGHLGRPRHRRQRLDDLVELA